MPVRPRYAGKPGDVLIDPTGLAVERAAPLRFRRDTQLNELDIQYAGFLLWAAQPHNDRSIRLASQVLTRNEKTLRKWRMRYLWRERVGTGPEGEGQAKLLLRALFPSLVPKLVGTMTGTPVVDQVNAEAARDMLNEILGVTHSPGANAQPGMPSQPMSPATSQPHVPTEQERATKNLDRMATLLDAGFALLGKDVQDRKASAPRWSDVPAMIKARRLIENKPTVIVQGGGEVHEESLRVQEARRTGEPAQVIAALREDANELVVILDGLAARYDAGDNIENLIAFPAATAPRSS